MQKDPPNSGFLSKMVKFVRHPATSWSDLDLASDAQDAAQSKLLLKEMIERKRRNDFVRKREFEMLRRIRARLSSFEPRYAGRPSFFQSSYSSKPGDRAGTLKKIDEIEAQMSMQWWKTSQGGSNPAGASTLPSHTADSTLPFRTTVPQDNSPTVPFVDPPETKTVHTTVPTLQTGAVPPDVEPSVLSDSELQASSMSLPEAGETRPGDLSGASGFSASKYYALDVQDLALDPEIEEAAIRYSGGDDLGAEQGLLDILTRKASNGTVDEWMALFDLYRATGNLASFDAHAVDFANRFSRSAPQWFSMPDEVEAKAARVFQSSDHLGRATWSAEAELDAHSVAVLARTLERAAQPWVMDWSALGSVQPVAAVRLLKLMTDWANMPVDVRFVGARRLREVMLAHTPSGDRTKDRIWWDLRLAGLRVMNMSDDFELAALDFCVTYEVSPPGWEPPVCHFRSLTTVNDAATSEPMEYRQKPRGFVDSSPPMQSLGPPELPFEPTRSTPFTTLSPPVYDLMGVLSGDLQQHFDQIDQIHGDDSVRTVSCRNLIRVDFSAAGSIFNWVSTQHALGREVHFTDVHRLIAAFFHVIGITEHAKVVTRDD